MTTTSILIIQPKPSFNKAANLVREGKTNDEIADLLFLSTNTILSHRYHLRSKLGLKNKKINLRTYLKALDKSSEF